MMVRLADEDLSSVIDGAGPLAGLFVILLAVAVFIIWKSMNRQFKREQAADRRYTEQAVERGEEPAPSTEQGKDDIAPAG